MDNSSSLVNSVDFAGLDQILDNSTQHRAGDPPTQGTKWCPNGLHRDSWVIELASHKTWLKNGKTRYHLYKMGSLIVMCRLINIFEFIAKVLKKCIYSQNPSSLNVIFLCFQ